MYIKHLEVSVLSSIIDSIKSSCNLIGNRFVIPHFIILSNVMQHIQKPYNYE
jgi:hypothetical protein